MIDYRSGLSGRCPDLCFITVWIVEPRGLIEAGSP